jgi:hypothetical protein
MINGLRRKTMFWKAKAAALAVFVGLVILVFLVITKLGNMKANANLEPAATAISGSSKSPVSPPAAETVAATVEKEPGELTASPGPEPAGAPVRGGTLRVHPENPRYFTNDTGQVIYLTGSHYWWNLQDVDTKYPLGRSFDYVAYLDMLVENKHNFIRLWFWEVAFVDTPKEDYWFSPMPYPRPGPGLAQDRKPKYDVSRFNQEYFDRLRQRVIDAGKRGVYVSIMLFDGWGVENKDNEHNPWPGHPYNPANNINGIDGDPNKDGAGREVHTLNIEAINDLQLAYVHKVIDTVNDLDNVLYEISNESSGDSLAWQYAMIDEIHRYEARKARQHPVGMTVIYPAGSNADLLASPAEWISPNGDINNPEAAAGKKVVLYDTDHLCGICGDRKWVWRSLTRGLNPILMDPYEEDNSPIWAEIRRNMGYARQYADRINLAKMIPRGDLASSGYALAYTGSESAEYLVYLPESRNVTVDLSAAVGELKVEWFNPSNGARAAGKTVTGGAKRSFTSPFSGTDSVLYIHQRQITWLSLIINQREKDLNG